MTDIEDDPGLGNTLNRMMSGAKTLLFNQGELAQLSHSSLFNTLQSINDGDLEEYEITYPVGYKPTKEAILSTHTYKKDDLVQRYNHLTYYQIPVNGIFQLATIMEVMFTEVVRSVVRSFPEKMGSKRQIPVSVVLKSGSIEQIQIAATDTFLNELSYKSPREFAKEVENLLSVNLLECAAYHSYIEMKATRDVLIHNAGYANEVYVSKAGSHARVARGVELPMDQVYFLECYESCFLRVVEWLEEALHKTWHSSEFYERQQRAE
jgi:hypothetical protein